MPGLLSRQNAGSTAAVRGYRRFARMKIRETAACAGEEVVRRLFRNADEGRKRIESLRG
jgi:hypothetical protein